MMTISTLSVGSSTRLHPKTSQFGCNSLHSFVNCTPRTFAGRRARADCVAFACKPQFQDYWRYPSGVFKPASFSSSRGSPRNVDETFSRQMEDLLTAFWRPNAQGRSCSFPLLVDIHEDADKLVVKADMPGFERKDIKVEVSPDREMLTISGHRLRPETTGVEEEGRFRRERPTGHFKRSLRLPERSQPDGITASLDKGVLTVVVPRTGQAPAGWEVPINAAPPSTEGNVSGVGVKEAPAFEEPPASDVGEAGGPQDPATQNISSAPRQSGEIAPKVSGQPVIPLEEMSKNPLQSEQPSTIQDISQGTAPLEGTLAPTTLAETQASPLSQKEAPATPVEEDAQGFSFEEGSQPRRPEQDSQQ